MDGKQARGEDVKELRFKTHESNSRSLLKSLTYRVYQSFIISPMILYLLTGNVVLAFSFSIVEFLVKIPAYFLFERMWSLVKHGYIFRQENVKKQRNG